MTANTAHQAPRRAPRSTGLALTLLGLLLVTHASIGVAADDKKADREARRAELLQQRFEQERAAWDKEKADLTQKLADAQTASSAQKAQSDKVTEDLTKSTSERAGLQKKLADTQRQLAEATSAAEKAATADKTASDLVMRARQQERSAQSARYDTQTAALNVCTDKNQRLLQISHELLQRYRNKGVIDALRQDDPVLGFKDVEIFNQVQDYRDRIDAEALHPADATKP